MVLPEQRVSQQLASLISAGQKLDKFDVVITTYQTLASEHAMDKAESDSDNPKRGGALMERKWLRVVLGKRIENMTYSR